MRNTFEFALAIGNLTISFIIAAVENSRAVGFALMLIVVATTVTLFVVFRVKGRVARR